MVKGNKNFLALNQLSVTIFKGLYEF